MKRARTLLSLVRHPDTPCAGIDQIDVALEPDERDVLRLCYRLSGDARDVVAAPLEPGARTERRDELWRSTCCELFVGDAEGSGYHEYNFAPSGHWAAYRFSDYRAGVAPLETAAPRVVFERSPQALVLTVTLPGLPISALERRRIGLSCIVETKSALSYWALAHPPGRPDFHHAAAFALTFSMNHATDLIG